jgi:KaiC/GvpD/RAD55 family RecA-like ATPase
MEKIKSGIPGFDSMVAGGIPKGRTLLVSGHCGSGKTIFATQFAYHGLKNKEKAVYVTFEQGSKKLCEDVSMIGMNLAGYIKTDKLKVIGGHLGKIHRFKLRTEAKAQDIIDEIKEVVDDLGATRVVIDSINLFAMLFHDDDHRRDAVAMLISALEEMGCTTILTCEVPEDTEKISWYGFEDFVVDGVLFLHRKLNKGTYERAISIIKMRGSKHDNNLRAMAIKDKGIIIYDQEPDFIRC